MPAARSHREGCAGTVRRSRPIPGRWHDAVREIAAYRRLSDRHDRDPEFADSERALGRPEKAVEILSELRPDDVDEDVFIEALVVRAGALLDMGRPDEAVAVLETG